ncbi:MAG: PAS domain S-box protein, partial [Gammaproteobacteria bacterium]
GRALAETIVPEKNRHAHNQGLKHYLETGEGPVLQKRIEIDAMRKDGSEFPVELAIDVVKSQNEALFVAYLRDISQRKRNEDELERQRLQLKFEAERNRLLLQVASDGIHILNAEGRIIIATEAFAHGLGYSVDEVIGMHPSQWDTLFSREDIDLKILPDLLQKTDIFRFETKHRRRNGSPFDVEVATRAVNLNGESLLFCSSRDISERKRVASELASSRDLLRTVLDTAPMRVFWKDRELRYLGCNRAFAKDAGKQMPQEVIGKDDYDMVWADQAESYRDVDLEVIRTGQAKLGYEELRTIPDGRQIWLRVSEVPLKLGGDEIVGVLGVYWDFTERKLAELRLLQSEKELKKLSLVASRTDNAVVFTDAAGRIEWINDGFTRITGWVLDDIVGRKPGEFLQGPETDPTAVQYMGECIRGGRAFKTEIINYHRDGHPYWISIEVQPICNDAGEVINFMGIESDISESKRAQAALEDYSRHLEELVGARTAELQSNKALLEAIFKTTPNGLLLIDQSGKIRMTNAALDKMFGFVESELMGQKLEILVPEPKRHKHSSLHQEYMRQPRTRVMGEGLELFGQRKDGSLFPIDVSLATFTVNEEQLSQATVADITSRKLAEEELRDLNANLERKVESRTAELFAANAAKSEFLANMSHEIRTPMNGILGLAQLLEREHLTADQHDMVTRIRIAGQSLLGIINDVLDFSKIEAGHLKIDLQPFLLASMLAQINSLMGPAAHAKGVDLHIEALEEGLTGELIGDVLRLEQILINLIGNAIKFTDKGEVRVIVHTLSLTEKSVSLRFEVTDTGIGISQDHIVSLFTPFTQGDATITRRYGGTGLGLSICKRLVNLMGGQIGVESSVGFGSTFWFELPLARGAELHALSSTLTRPSPVFTEGPRLSGMHFLVVDDSRMNREVIERTLIREGARVTLAVDGQQALQYLNLQNDKGFDAVLMDVQMPVLDGLAATRAIRGELGLKDLPVIAFTAGVLAEQREQARVAGCNDFVAKPVDLEELVTVLLRWTAVAPLSIPASVKEISQGFPDIAGLDTQAARSLLGDDSDLFLELLKSFVAEFGTAASEIRDDLRNGDRETAARRLHTFRSAAGYLGAVELTQSAQNLENAIKQQKPDLDLLIDDFVSKLDRLLEASAPWRK